jgi:hypothetical protein
LSSRNSRARTLPLDASGAAQANGTDAAASDQPGVDLLPPLEAARRPLVAQAQQGGEVEAAEHDASPRIGLEHAASVAAIGHA